VAHSKALLGERCKNGHLSAFVLKTFLGLFQMKKAHDLGLALALRNPLPVHELP
jgi:hypothetical protein